MDQAAEDHRQALAAAQAIGDRQGECQALTNLGNARSWRVDSRPPPSISSRL
jgi:hypothetical protein